MAAPADAQPGAAARGDLLDDRYRLEQVRAEHELATAHVVLWRAVDEPLERKAAVRVVTGLDKAHREQLIEAATAASRVSDSRFVRVLDVGTLGSRRDVAVWIATEWVEAPSLAARLRDEPLRPAVATDVVRQCAEAIAALDTLGLQHGRLHPDQVMLPAAGHPRLTGLETAAGLHDEPPVDDVQALGALLFAALTGRWPLAGWTGLPGLDPRIARAGRPRQVRAGISADLDEATHRALSDRYVDAAAFARALAALPAEPLDTPATPVLPRRPGVLRKWAWRVVPPLLVLAIGLTGWALGSDLGRIPTSARQPQAALPPPNAAAPGSGVAHLVWKRPPTISSFDPEGDGQENDSAAGLAVDRDPTTSWQTDLYASPKLGGLKSGVGLLVDLGRPTSVRVAELALAPAGASVEIRAGNAAPSQASDLPVVAAQANAGLHPKLTFPHSVSARYWLVWFTGLPQDGSGYRVGVAEIALLG